MRILFLPGAHSRQAHKSFLVLCFLSLSFFSLHIPLSSTLSLITSWIHKTFSLSLARWAVGWVALRKIAKSRIAYGNKLRQNRDITSRTMRFIRLSQWGTVGMGPHPFIFRCTNRRLSIWRGIRLYIVHEYERICTPDNF